MSLFPLFYRRLPAQMQTPPEFTITLQYSLFRPQNQELQTIFGQDPGLRMPRANRLETIVQKCYN